MNTLEKVQKSIRLVAVTALTLGMVSCSDDDNNTPINEEEVITTVTVRLTGGGQVITLTSRDLDGDGPNAPVVTASGNLAPNTTYTGTVSFLNEAETPAEDKTAEILAEGLEHQVFFQPTSGLGT
ncbi:MAG: type 1 periplasmic binding fold superfamily protein, partial [Flavobacterium sp.]